VVHSRAFTSPSDRTYPIFRVHERSEHVPIAYGYAVAEAERFRLDLGWFYTLCRFESDNEPATD